MTNEEIQKIREIRIHRILHITDTGSRYSICCPITSERTPSFVLYPDNSFFCFGCRASGKGAIDFTMALGYSFTDAINELKQYV